MEVRAGEVAGLDQVVELVEVLLQLINGFMQTGFDQVVDPHIAPAGQELSAQTVEVIRRVLARELLDLLQGVADALEAVPHRARKDRVQQQKACHRCRADTSNLNVDSTLTQRRVHNVEIAF